MHVPAQQLWEVGKEVHAHIIDTEYESDMCVGNALVNMYSKCGSLGDARLVFDKMGKRDVISWNALIGGLALSRVWSRGSATI